jgi:hypothetical protein
MAVVLPTVTALLFPGVLTRSPAWAQQQASRAGDPPISRAEYAACQARDVATLRPAIEEITRRTLERGIAGLDYKAAIADEWRKANVDPILAERIDKAIAEIRSETGFTEQISSLFSRETAQQLATTAAERVYRSDQFKAIIETLSNGVGRDVGKRLELATADAAGPALRCLEAFLGPRYGTTIAGVVASDAGREFAIDTSKGAAGVSGARVIAEGGEGIAGAVILIVRRQLANLASRIGQRLVGAVLSRVVSVIAGGIGVVLIAKDLWELRHGALPIIAAEMKAPATRDRVQDELARAIGDQINEHLREIAAKSTDRVVEIWDEFRRAHAKVVELAERDEGFRRFVDTVSPKNLPRLDEVVGLILVSEGEPAILRRLADGTLHEAVERLPAAALTIARDLRSLAPALSWASLAGDKIGRVAETELHRRAQPGDISKASLTRLIGLDDRVALARLASLKESERAPLLEVSDSELKHLARALSEAELSSLSIYKTNLQPRAGQKLLAAVASTPARMQTIAPQWVRDAILASRDQSAALDLMLRPDDLLDVRLLVRDLEVVREGRVSWQLLVARHPLGLAGAALIALVLLAFVWRAIFGRRPRSTLRAG